MGLKQRNVWLITYWKTTFDSASVTEIIILQIFCTALNVAINMLSLECCVLFFSGYKMLSFEREEMEYSISNTTLLTE